MPSLFEYEDSGTVAAARSGGNLKGGKNRVRACDPCRRKKGVCIVYLRCRELTARPVRCECLLAVLDVRHVGDAVQATERKLCLTSGTPVRTASRTGMSAHTLLRQRSVKRHSRLLRNADSWFILLRIDSKMLS